LAIPVSFLSCQICLLQYSLLAAKRRACFSAGRVYEDDFYVSR
jgi:hypothetical protein